MFMGKSSILFLICILYMGHIEPGIVRIDTIRTVDDKKITFLGDNHGLDTGEQEQVNEILSWLQQREKANEPTHILLEQNSWLADIYDYQSAVLFSLPQQTQQATPKITQVTFENMDIRHVAKFAYDLLTWFLPCQLKAYRERMIDTQKTLGTFSFQDVLNEFIQIKQSLSDYYLSQNNSVMSDIYTKQIAPADASYKLLLQIMKNNEINPDSFILKYANKYFPVKKEPLAAVIHAAFSPLCDLHLTRILLTSPHKNMIVLAGAWHNQRADSAFHDLNAVSLYSAGKVMAKDPVSITSAQLQRALSAQKQSLMRMYAPTMVKSAMAVVLCYFLYIAMLQVVMQTSIS